ncbi:cytochrome P450 81E8-like isoform X1 [Prunus yedoensis var. nudiflora]|uniref:Cytochrome P450 81E8-like isoform X1 n=1 Tax=Prunus yedoensis var. nudiflora TaxID=2094558 RepID=A0A314Z7W2_PRUYE|nr:cytochrome P450 81E8-like isoform X1 [Prunus yedoensis var. nudiflora]
MKEVFAHGANPTDFLPILNWVGSNAYEKRVMKLAKRIDAFLQGLVDEHRSRTSKGGNGSTMIDHLLSLQESQPEYYTDQIIKGLILTRLELDDLLGQERLVDESDISKLPTFKILSLRLFGCTQQPRYDCTIGGFHIPRDTMEFINAWAIHRDSELWSDPETFRPERFESGGDMRTSSSHLDWEEGLAQEQG